MSEKENSSPNSVQHILIAEIESSTSEVFKARSSESLSNTSPVEEPELFDDGDVYSENPNELPAQKTEEPSIALKLNTDTEMNDGENYDE